MVEIRARQTMALRPHQALNEFQLACNGFLNGILCRFQIFYILTIPLPSLRLTDFYTEFRRQLQTYLFKRAFDCQHSLTVMRCCSCNNLYMFISVLPIYV